MTSPEQRTKELVEDPDEPRQGRKSVHRAAALCDRSLFLRERERPSNLRPRALGGLRSLRDRRGDRLHLWHSKALRGGDKDPAKSSGGYGGNCNLEEISDYLVLAASRTLGDEVGEKSVSYAFALLVASSCLGFFVTYLFARRALPALFLRADEEGRALTLAAANQLEAAKRAVLFGKTLLREARLLVASTARTIAQLPEPPADTPEARTWRGLATSAEPIVRPT